MNNRECSRCAPGRVSRRIFGGFVLKLPTVADF